MYLYSLDEKKGVPVGKTYIHASQPATQHTQTHTKNPKTIKLSFRQRMLYCEGGPLRILGTAYSTCCGCHQKIGQYWLILFNPF